MQFRTHVHPNGSRQVTIDGDFDQRAEFSTELLAEADPAVLSVAHGRICIRVANGWANYIIDSVTAWGNMVGRLNVARRYDVRLAEYPGVDPT